MSDGRVETAEAAAARFLNSLFKSSHILVAISGGGDSVGLLVALAEAIRAGNHAHKLSAATVDHGLRAESAGEARDVAKLCTSLGIAHQSQRWEGVKPSTGLMAAAREVRYELLAEMAEVVGADLIVTAHTSDDQQETLTMRGARVAADAALPARGIADAVLFDRRIWVSRPFLNCRREDIREFLVERGVVWIDDPSNEDMHYERVRVRTELRSSSQSTAMTFDANAAIELSAQAAGWLDTHVRVYAAMLCEIARDGLTSDRAVVAYALSHLAAVLGGQAYGLGREKLDRIIEFLDQGERGRRTAGGVVFDLRRESLYLMREDRNISVLALPAGGRGTWDGRFDVVNRGNEVARIMAGDPTSGLSLPTVVPKGVAQRVRATSPGMLVQDDIGEKSKDTVTVTPRFAPFDRFLTRSDYPFADRLALSFARTPYLPPPL